MRYTEKFNGKHYDVGTGSNISLNEVKDIVREHFPDLEFNYTEPRPGDVMLTCAKSDSLRKLGWETQVSIKEGINNCFRGVKNELS